MTDGEEEVFLRGVGGEGMHRDDCVEVRLWPILEFAHARLARFALFQHHGGEHMDQALSLFDALDGGVREGLLLWVTRFHTREA